MFYRPLSLTDVSRHSKGEQDSRRLQERYCILFEGFLLVCVRKPDRLSVKFVLPLTSGILDLNVTVSPAPTYGLVLRVAGVGAFLFGLSVYADYETWVFDIRSALFACERQRSGFAPLFGWKHRIVRGTLHSAALFADMITFKQILTRHENSVHVRHVGGSFEATLPSRSKRGAESASRGGLAVFLDIMDTEKVPLIHYAIVSGVDDFVRWLIESGASVHSEDATGNTPLHVAVHRAERDMILLLLERGAQPNACNNAGQVPLAVALQVSHTSFPLDHIARAFALYGAREERVIVTQAALQRHPALEPTIWDRLMAAIFSPTPVSLVCPSFAEARAMYIDANLDDVSLQPDGTIVMI